MHQCPYCKSPCRCDADPDRRTPYQDEGDCTHFIFGRCEPPDKEN